MIAGINKNYIGGFRESHHILCGDDGYEYIVKYIKNSVKILATC